MKRQLVSQKTGADYDFCELMEEGAGVKTRWESCYELYVSKIAFVTALQKIWTTQAGGIGAIPTTLSGISVIH